MKLNIYKKLLLIQNELKAPKGKTNTFGKYKYRSCEDILEALKPVSLKHGCLCFISDEIIAVDNRFYVKATITIVNCDEPTEQITISAMAREADKKRGMDDSQITGTASSYARKYACNGLFLIDDTKDADTDEHHKEKKARVKKEETIIFIAQNYKPLQSLIKESTGSEPGDYTDFLQKKYKMNNWSRQDADRFIKKVKAGEITPFE